MDKVEWGNDEAWYQARIAELGAELAATVDQANGQAEVSADYGRQLREAEAERDRLRGEAWEALTEAYYIEVLLTMNRDEQRRRLEAEARVAELEALLREARAALAG